MIRTPYVFYLFFLLQPFSKFSVEQYHAWDYNKYSHAKPQRIKNKELENFSHRFSLIKHRFQELMNKGFKKTNNKYEKEFLLHFSKYCFLVAFVPLCDYCFNLG